MSGCLVGWRAALAASDCLPDAFGSFPVAVAMTARARPAE